MPGHDDLYASALAKLVSQHPDQNPGSPMATGFEADPLATQRGGDATGGLQPRVQGGGGKLADPFLTALIAQAQLGLQPGTLLSRRPVLPPRGGLTHFLLGGLR